MSTYNLYNIAGIGLNIEKTRLQVVANNIAHQNTLITTDGNGYQPQMVKTHRVDFNTFIATDTKAAVVSVENMDITPRSVYEPTHPMADRDGYLHYPNISTTDEMTHLITATRAYEANVRILRAAHQLYQQSLSIGEER